MKTAFLVGAVVLSWASTVVADAPQRMSYGRRSICTELQGTSIPAVAIGLPTTGAIVVKATLVPADGSNALGEYCLIDGEIEPVDPKAQKINFQTAMPSQWNGKLIQLGGGGFDGRVVSPVGLGPDTALAAPPPALARGYVSYGSDSGHEGASDVDASFALNEEQLRNFAGEQLKKTHDAVLFLVKARYGAEPAHSYFIGGSEGGREAIIAIQRYPDDYDGVVSIFPTLDPTAVLLKMQLIARSMRLNKAAGWISKDKAAFLRKSELAACDKLDGLEDSIISNGDACRIDLKSMRCPGGKDTGSECFSDAQLRTLQIMHSPTKLPYTLAGGETSLPAYSIGADFSSVLSGSDPLSPATGPDLYFLFSEAFVRYLWMRNSKADSLTFDPLRPGRVLARVLEVSNLLDGNSLDIDRFVGRGGKWIVVHGLSDEAVPSSETIEYYRRLVAKYGQAKTDEFLRLYLVPGYGHGHGLSFNANRGPGLDALEAWVERGQAPGTLTIVDANPEALDRSRPMCVYPAWPKYTGSGDPNQARNFSCAITH